MNAKRVAHCILAGGALVLGSSIALAKECYSPDARAKERAFSRAVITEGGKTIWLAGQTASDPKLGFEAQVRDVFANLEKRSKAQAAPDCATWLR